LRDKIKDYQDKREDFDYFINVQWENWKKEYKEKVNNKLISINMTNPKYRPLNLIKSMKN
jgi:hypothetical protein